MSTKVSIRPLPECTLLTKGNKESLVGNVVKQTGNRSFSESVVRAMMFLGAFLFILFFVLMAPKSQAFLLGLAASAGVWIADWAPFSYLILLILLVAPFAGMYVVRTWPVRVDEENPMAKYRREMPLDED
jgi:hypothetical protein